VLRALFLVLAALFMMTTSGAQAADLQEGMDAFRAKNYETAFAEFSVLAEEGHVEAQYYLAVMYQYGKGVVRDYVAAVKWYTLAAEQGIAVPQYNLSVMYYLGDGVAQNHVTALMWANVSAENGYERALELVDFIAEKMSQADIARAEEMARECMESKYKNCER